MKNLSFRFDLSKKKNCSIDSVTIKETTGRDEEKAAQLARAKGAKESVFEELMRLSIVAVNDTPVDQPYSGLDDWNSKTRSYILQAFQSINGIGGDGELDDFLSSAVPQEQ